MIKRLERGKKRKNVKIRIQKIKEKEQNSTKKELIKN